MGGVAGHEIYYTQGVHSVRKVRKVRIGQDISVTLGMVRKNMEKLGKKVRKILNIVHGQEKVRENTMIKN